MHDGLGALGDLVEGCVVMWVIVGYAVGDDDAAADGLGVIKGGDHFAEIFAVVVVCSAKDDDKLVAPDPVDGAVLVDMRDGAGGLFDEFVAFGVTVGVIDFLETVHVAADNGKGTGGSVEDVCVDLIFVFEEVLSAADTGEIVEIGQAVCFGLLFFAADLFVYVANADDDVGVIVVFGAGGFELDV